MCGPEQEHSLMTSVSVHVCAMQRCRGNGCDLVAYDHFDRCAHRDGIVAAHAQHINPRLHVLHLLD